MSNGTFAWEDRHHRCTFHSHTPQHFACREIGYIFEPCFSLSPATKLLNSFLWTCFECLGVQTCMYTSCLLALNSGLYGIHIFRFPDLTCTVRQNCWHFEYKITLPLLYISKRYIAHSDKIAMTYPLEV